jgi:hypothetical protein
MTRRWRRAHRGVSDVVATILILAITVTLFASLFAFVDSFPPPPAQSVNEFKASLQYTANNSYIQSLSILMTGGPVITPSDSVYMKSAANPGLPAFNTAIPVAWGINNASVWTVGQSWVYTFGATHLPKLPDNITVFLVSTTQLLYSTTIPGSVPNLPPSVVAAGTTPGTLVVGQAFQIYAQFSGNLTGGTPTVNVAGIPGLTGTKTMAKYNGEYVWNVTLGNTTTAGSYDAWLSETNGAGQTATAEVPITITSTGGGGGSSVTVSVGMSPQPPTLPLVGSAYFWANVWYPGSKTSVPVSVNFTISQIAGGRSTPLTVTNTIPGQTGLTISGPSSLTVYSQAASNFNNWLLNSSVTITATVTLGMSVGTFTGTIEYPTQNLVQGIVYFTTSITGSTGSSTHSFSHSCTSSTCPFLYLTVWDNFTTGPTPLSFTGSVTTNSTTGGHTHTYGIAATSVASAGSTVLNVVTAGSTTAHWTSPGGGTGTVYNAAMWLTISSGGTTIGYIYDTFTATFT